jgi:hypothetical protein
MLINWDQWMKRNQDLSVLHGSLSSDKLHFQNLFKAIDHLERNLAQ